MDDFVLPKTICSSNGIQSSMSDTLNDSSGVDKQGIHDDYAGEEQVGEGEIPSSTSLTRSLTTGSSSSFSSKCNVNTSIKTQPMSAERVRYLELSVMCYCRSAPRILNLEACRIIQRIFPGVKVFRYHYEGALRGADVESTRSILRQFGTAWVGKNGSVDIVC